MTTSLIVIVADRAEHLGHVMAGVARSARQPDEVVIVDMGSRDDPRSVVGRHASGVPITWVDVSRRPDGRLPLAAARNAGAGHSTADRLIFCDVDCIPHRDMIGAYEDAIERGGIICGPVRYLERFWSASLDFEHPDIDLDLWARSAPNPGRPPVSVETVDERHELFWSLAFGLERDTWERIGGFDEAYVGYGGEDTDFGFTARALDIPLRWITGGTAFHQWHPGSDPPVENLPALVDNARRFRLRWGRWPMEGWLRALHRSGHVVWNPATSQLRQTPTAPRRPSRLRVVSIPASHAYTRRVVPDDVDVAADPTDPWWPHLALDPTWIASELHRIDVVHLHFGFEHRTPSELESWCDTLADNGIGLVVTVHDLLNPHTPDNGRHEQHLVTLLRRADAVITLTTGAAARIEEVWGRRPQVMAHPHVAPLDWQSQFPRRTSCRRPRRVGVHFSSFRSNVLNPEGLLDGLSAGVRDSGATLSVRADSGAPANDLRRLTAAADRVSAQLLVSDRLGDGMLVGALTKLDVVVLPYAFGTHSGMVELCHDLGCRVLVPDVGYYREQWRDVVTFRLDEDRRPNSELVRAATVDALDREPAEPAARSWREAQRRDVMSDHSRVYVDVAGSVPLVTSPPTLFVHIGPSRHGVTRYGSVLAAAAQQNAAVRSIRLQSPSRLDGLAAAVAAARPAVVHLQFTEGIYGCDPLRAAASCRAIIEVARPAMASVTLHDVPTVGVEPASQLERQSAYRQVAESADVVVVCSHHEAQRVEAISDVPAAVIPHFVESRASGRPGRTQGVGVLGFLYPGKGHAAVVSACGRMSDPAQVVAIGGPSRSHQALADELVAVARDLAVPLRITGWVDDHALSARMARIAVPVVANTHGSASGSLASWLGSHRRPLVGAGPYTEEVSELAPGCLTAYALGDPDALRHAIDSAQRHPEGTWQDAVPVHLHPRRIAARHTELFRSVM